LIQQQNPSAEQWQALQFIVFDLPDAAGSYRQRYQRLQQLVEGKPFLQLPVYHPYSGPAELTHQLDELSKQGGEGLMLRDPDALYLATRSKALIKYKSYQDGEAEVVGYSPGQGKYQNVVGALVVKDAQGRLFKLGSGLTEQQRAKPPAIGSMVHYRYNGLTSKGKPRFARFVRQYQAL
uniref:DNA ligase n=1 Tax=Agarivorans sp. TaxID=1872412 RepID=UPI003D062A53